MAFDPRSSSTRQALASARRNLSVAGKELFKVYGVKKNGKLSARPTGTLSGQTVVTEAEANEIKARMEQNNPGCSWVIVPN